MKVFVLQHERKIDDADEVKLIGIYDSAELAKRAKVHCAELPGFRSFPEGFSIDAYDMNVGHWTSGFTTTEAVAAEIGPKTQSPKVKAAAVKRPVGLKKIGPTRKAG